jgi:hypothetical protein
MSHRTQITLTDAQYERLRSESARSGLGLAELVRRAIERSYGAADHDQLLEVLDDSFGSWADHERDGAAFVENLRRGMPRRLADA